MSRYHSERLIRSQSVGEHTYNVLCLIMYLTEGKATRELMAAAMIHDLPEFRLGDAPAPVKWNYKKLKEEYERAERMVWDELDLEGPSYLEPLEQVILKAADSFECALYAIEEYQTGNARMVNVANNALHFIMENLLARLRGMYPNAEKLYKFCRSRLP